MKTSQTIIFLLLLATIFSCETRKRPDIHFYTKFPDHYRDLTHALPDTFKVKYNVNDTSLFRIEYDKKTGINYIIDINKRDTLFEGYAGKYNGLYFLSRMINDSSFHIHALHTDGYTIKGLHTEGIQVKLANSAYKGDFKNIVVKENDTLILLEPKKEVLFPFYKHLLEKLRGDTILDYDLHMKQRALSQ